MGKRRALFVVAALVAALVACVSGYDDERQPWGGGGEEERQPWGGGGEEERQPWGGGEEGASGRREGKEYFLLQDSKHVVQTDAGDMRVVRGFGGRFMRSPMHIGFITMEPKSLFVPQYIDCSLILFIRRGGARVGHIYKDEFVERTLKMGDIYRIEAGSTFYLVNTAEGQRLHVITSIDTTQSLGFHSFQSFYVAGGRNPKSILSGFDRLTMSTAFNVSESELEEMLTRQSEGPIVFLSDSHSPSTTWAKFLEMEKHQKVAHLRRIVQIREEDIEQDKEEEPMWFLRKLLIPFFGRRGDRKGDTKGTRSTGKGPDSYNIYNRKPDFKNDYGWSIALDESDYSPLKHEDIGVYLVNLTAGSMMAPHINPRAIEYGVVLGGSGTIQIVYPNGTLAMNAKVQEGDVFWIPRYFPFCQIASRTGPFEFFGFTSSARNNRPQFLVGSGSLLQTMRGPEFAAAFGISEDRLKEIINAQRESTILPSAVVAPPDAGVAEKEKMVVEKKLDRGGEKMAKIMRNFGHDMVMGFD